LVRITAPAIRKPINPTKSPPSTIFFNMMYSPFVVRFM
jgi:hypothetical protein